jgi:hypothetical protein
MILMEIEMTTHKKCQMANCSSRATRKLKLLPTSEKIGDPKRRVKFNVCETCFLVWTDGREELNSADLLADRIRYEDTQRFTDEDLKLDIAIKKDLLGLRKSSK